MECAKSRKKGEVLEITMISRVVLFDLAHPPRPACEPRTMRAAARAERSLLPTRVACHTSCMLICAPHPARVAHKTRRARGKPLTLCVARYVHRLLRRAVVSLTSLVAAYLPIHLMQPRRCWTIFTALLRSPSPPASLPPFSARPCLKTRFPFHI